MHDSYRSEYISQQNNKAANFHGGFICVLPKLEKSESRA